MHSIVLEFVNNPPTIQAEKVVARPVEVSPSVVEREDLHPSAIALPSVPKECEELTKLSTDQLRDLVNDEGKLDAFVAKLPLWTSITSLRESIESDVIMVANQHLELGREVESVRREIDELQLQVRAAFDSFQSVRQRQDQILSESSSVNLAKLFLEKANKIDAVSDQLQQEFISGSMTEDEFIKSYRSQRHDFHRLTVYRERLLHQR